MCDYYVIFTYLLRKDVGSFQIVLSSHHIALKHRVHLCGGRGLQDRVLNAPGVMRHLEVDYTKTIE